MISNSDVTIYHKTINLANRLEEWNRYNYSNIWFFGGKRASIDKGYDDTNFVEIRIPLTESVDINNFSIGDIIVKGSLTTDISTQQDLQSYTTFNIIAINNNDFGNNPHIHITGK